MGTQSVLAARWDRARRTTCCSPAGGGTDGEVPPPLGFTSMKSTSSRNYRVPGTGLFYYYYRILQIPHLFLSLVYIWAFQLISSTLLGGGHGERAHLSQVRTYPHC